MRWRHHLSGLRSLLNRRRSESDIGDEIESHLEFQTRKHMATNMTEEEARRRAAIELGGPQQTREQVRDIDRWRWLDIFSRNFRHALRSLVKTPVFSLTAILILGVGVGANLVVFSLLDFLLLRPLPVDHPEELVRIAWAGKDGYLGYLPSTILDPLGNGFGLRGVCGLHTEREGLDVNGALHAREIIVLTGDCFSTLGVHVQLGRPLTPADDVHGAPGAAVISGALWRREFGSNPGVLGKSVRLANVPFTIVGVAEDRFQGVLLGNPADVLVPLHQGPAFGNGPQSTGYDWVLAIARRATGVPQDRVSAAIEARTASLLEQSAPASFSSAERKHYLSQRLTVTSCETGVDFYLRQRFRKPLLAILGICAPILIVACVNLANLLLARSLRRRPELRMRLMLGARPSHIAGMLALESSLLVIAGAGLGLLLALWGDRLVLAHSAGLSGGLVIAPAFDVRVAMFLAATALLIGLALAFASACQSGRIRDLAQLRQAGRRVITGGRARQILLGAQITLTLALVAVANLLGASMRGLYQMDLGFKTDHVWYALLASRSDEGANPSPGPYYRDLLSQVESMPNVRAAALSTKAPLYTLSLRLFAPVSEVPSTGRTLQGELVVASDTFFKTLGMKFIAGDGFRREDGPASERTAIVSQALAERLGGVHAILGRLINGGGPYKRLKVIGVAADTQLDFNDPRSAGKPLIVYVNLWQHPGTATMYPVVLIKTHGGPLDAARLRGIVEAKGLDYVDRVESVDDAKDAALVENRLAAYLSGAFGILALVLAATGLFGLLSYQVASRTAEIGVRVALGARRGQIQWFVVRQVLVIVAAGSLVGVALSLAAGQAIAGLLYGISGSDPWLLAVSFAVLAATALLAAWLPARRAAAVDPVVALRHE